MAVDRVVLAEDEVGVTEGVIEEEGEELAIELLDETTVLLGVGVGVGVELLLLEDVLALLLVLALIELEDETVELLLDRGVLLETGVLLDTGVLLAELEPESTELLAALLTTLELEDDATELLLDTGVLLAEDWLLEVVPTLLLMLELDDDTAELLAEDTLLEDNTDEDELETMLVVAALELADELVDETEGVGVTEDADELEGGRTFAPQTPAFGLAAPMPFLR